MTARRPNHSADWRLIAFHAGISTTRRPGRAVATVIGVALGVAVFLVTTGWSQTVGSQINQTFDELAATELTVRDTMADTATDAAMPADTPELLGRLDGVVTGGRIWEGGTRPIRTSAAADPADVPVLVADPEALRAARATLAAGRLLDDFPRDLAQPVAVVGPAAAHTLGLGEASIGATLTFTDTGTRATITGILASAGTAPELDRAVIVLPDAPVDTTGGPIPPRHMTAVIRVVLGTAAQVANAVPLLLRPDAPGRLGVLVPPEPAALRGSVQGTLDTLALGTAALALLIGGIGIMNSMLNAVNQRAGEIGLRRSMGAARRHIVAQFLLEGAILGTLGALIGAVSGEAVLIGLAWANGWAPVLARALLAAAPAAGLLVGVLAALYPAARAAAISPAVSLRS